MFNLKMWFRGKINLLLNSHKLQIKVTRRMSINMTIKLSLLGIIS